MEIIFAGDSWAVKGFTEENYNLGPVKPGPQDQRLADHWHRRYQGCYQPGRGNLDLLDHLVKNNIQPDIPVIWVYTEPGRDYGRITGSPEFGWIESEHIFEIRQDLNKKILNSIAKTLPNPIGLIGGLSDIDVDTAKSLGFDILHHSWQGWIAGKMDSQWFKFGWGASDIGWRMHTNNIRPSRAATFAWDEQIKEWCWWETQGWFCHEHPSPLCHLEFGTFLRSSVDAWIESL